MRILSCILLSSILLASPLKATAQEAAEKEKKESFWHMFTFKGIGFSADIFGCAASLVSDHISTEVAVEGNFGNRLYPIVEVGYGWCNSTDETTGIKYRANAPYYRAGFNYNFFTKKEKPNPKHYIYGLVRLGWSNFKYDVATPPITDPVWGGEVALDLKDVNGSCLWGEVGAGIKVNIAKGFHMGWSVRYKMRFTEKVGKNSRMWYIPGYGSNKSNVFGGTYSLIYDIPIK
jgi:hypothetical protein